MTADDAGSRRYAGCPTCHAIHPIEVDEIPADFYCVHRAGVLRRHRDSDGRFTRLVSVTVVWPHRESALIPR